MRRTSRLIKLLFFTILVILGSIIFRTNDVNTLDSSMRNHEQIDSPPGPQHTQDKPTFHVLQNRPVQTAKSAYNPKSKSHKRMNILFLMSDDLRPQLSMYDSVFSPNPESSLRMVTPNLEDLAKKSLVLQRAYVQLSMCGPSRASILTSRRPDTTRVWTQKGYWRKVGGNYTTIPQYFKENGYITAGFGKIFHPRKASGKDDPMSWTEPYYHPPDKRFWRKLGVSWRGFSEAELREKPHPDHMIAEAAIQKLRELAPSAKADGKPFFLGVGFLKPHLPFTFPKEFLKLYDEIDSPSNQYLPQHYPAAAYSKPTELLSMSDVGKLKFKGDFNETMPRMMAGDLRRAYFACVSYIDHLTGRVLKALKELGLEENTIVSFIGDHGWHLGENGMWGKHTNMEQGTRSPIMIHIPGKTMKAVYSSSIVEFVDLFPTLVEASGLDKIPECPRDSTNIELCTEGTSFLSLVENPGQKRNPAFSQHQLYRTRGMGYSIRTDRYRYTAWPRLEMTKRKYQLYDYDILWDSLAGQELYDHEIDPDENVNRANDIKYKGVIRELSKQLHQKISSSINNVKFPLI